MAKEQWIRKNKIPIVISLIVFISGIALGMAARPFAPFSIQLDDKINAVELFGILCTVALVWIVTSTLDRKKNVEQNAKALISRRVEEMYELSLRLHERAVAGEIPLVDVTSSLKRMTLTLGSVETALVNCSMTVDSKHKEDIDILIGKLNDLMTNTPIDRHNGPDCPMTIADGKLTFAHSRCLEITAAFDSLREQITTFQLAINDA